VLFCNSACQFLCWNFFFETVFAYESGWLWRVCLTDTGETSRCYTLPVRSNLQDRTVPRGSGQLEVCWHSNGNDSYYDFISFGIKGKCSVTDHSCSCLSSSGRCRCVISPLTLYVLQHRILDEGQRDEGREVGAVGVLQPQIAHLEAVFIVRP
jgi:hypothetical protein